MPAYEPPVVDVCILSWHRPKDTLEAIESALHQEGVVPHVWVVDQGSGPECVEGLRRLRDRDARVSLVELGRNVGIAAGRNRVMSLGSSEFIVSIDNDSVLERRDALARVAERFTRDPELGLIAFRIKNYTTGLDDEYSWAHPRSLMAQADREFLTARFCASGHALRRSALARTRGYEERLFLGWDELDLAYQLIGCGYTMRYDPAVTLLHKVKPGARYDWRRGRHLYYFVRNAVYINHKYLRSPLHTAMLGLGYLVRAAYNGVAPQAARGLLDALGMIVRRPPQPSVTLDAKARAYLREHDARHRGGLWQRIRRDVLRRLS